MIRLRRPRFVLALACCLSVAWGAACTSYQDRPPAEVTEAPTDVPVDPELPPIDVTDAVEVTQAPGRDYCTYRVITAAGPNCGPFVPYALICVDCPNNGTCPGAAGGRSAYRYLDAEGNVLCSGEWAKRFDVNAPDACLDCPIPPGIPGFEFVAR